jgi:hypothetical protein
MTQRKKKAQRTAPAKLPKRLIRELTILREFAGQFWVVKNMGTLGEAYVDAEARLHEIHEKWRHTMAGRTVTRHV